MPAFSGFLARQQLASDVNEIISVLSLARSEAIKQRRDVEVIFSPPSSFSSTRRPQACRNSEIEEDGLYRYVGWCYWVERGDDVLRIGQAANITALSSGFTIIFHSLGDAGFEGCTPPCEITISSQKENAAIDPVTLMINTTGSIRKKESGL